MFFKIDLLEENLHQPECTGVHALHTVSSGQHMPKLIVLDDLYNPLEFGTPKGVFTSGCFYNSVFAISLFIYHCVNWRDFHSFVVIC
jgi:hypothetical protein